jgi:predicted enzyme related to lactoylglutathione lyase
MDHLNPETVRRNLKDGWAATAKIEAAIPKGKKRAGIQEISVIIGAHVVIYTKDPEADRAFFRDVLGFSFVDAGDGWLIFAMPPLEAAFHDSSKNDQHELYLMCDNLAATLKTLKAKKVKVSKVSEQRWGKLATLTLPGGGKLGVYQPKHPSPLKQ